MSSRIATTIGATLLYRNGSYEGGPEVFRLYAGTFSRADSLMVGSGFAFLWVEGWVPRRCPTWLSLGAWAFFVFRCLHSLMHCTVNIVIVRFVLYLGSCIALFIMVSRALAANLGG